MTNDQGVIYQCQNYCLSMRPCGGRKTAWLIVNCGLNILTEERVEVALIFIILTEFPKSGRIKYCLWALCVSGWQHQWQYNLWILHSSLHRERQHYSAPPLHCCVTLETSTVKLTKKSKPWSKTVVCGYGRHYIVVWILYFVVLRRKLQWITDCCLISDLPPKTNQTKSSSIKIIDNNQPKLMRR